MALNCETLCKMVEVTSHESCQFQRRRNSPPRRRTCLHDHSARNHSHRPKRPACSCHLRLSGDSIGSGRYKVLRFPTVFSFHGWITGWISGFKVSKHGWYRDKPAACVSSDLHLRGRRRPSFFQRCYDPLWHDFLGGRMSIDEHPRYKWYIIPGIIQYLIEVGFNF